MIISLTGFMGCGKSSVGRRLSELLCCSFIDLDDVIEEREGRSIPEIFATEGEATFRQMELKALEHVINNGGMERVWKQSLPSHSAMGPSLCGQRGSTVSTPSPCHPEVERHTNNDIILALGGGAVMTEACAEMVRERTLCVYLRASVETLVEHLAGETAGRPMLADADLRTRIETLMQQRAATYEKTAHTIIDTDGKSIDEIACEIGKQVAQ